MKLECSKEKITRAVSNTEKISGKNLNLPILNSILLEAEENGVRVKATNLDLGVEVFFPAKVSSKGSVAVPGGVLVGLLSNLKDEKVGLELKGQQLVLSTPSVNSVINSMPTDEFPTIPRLSDERPFKIKASDFSQGVRSVWYSAAVSSMKPELSSVYIYRDDYGQIVFVATDSFRLAEKKIKSKKPESLEGFNQVLVPFKNIPEIIKVLEEAGSEEVEVSMNKNQISFSFGETYLTSRIVDSVFPDYQQIIPKEFKTEVNVLKQDFVSALRMANIFSGKFHQITTKVDTKNKVFELSSKSSEVGENTNKIEATLEGEDIEINFNHKYLVDCLQSIEADSISLSFSGLSKPMIIKGTTDNSFRYLVMPMNK